MINEYCILKCAKELSVEFLKVNVSEHSFPVHFHRRHCVGRIESGSLTIDRNGIVQTYRKDDCFVIPAFQCHCCVVQEELVYSVLCFTDKTSLEQISSIPEYLSEMKSYGLLSLFEYAMRAFFPVEPYNDAVKQLLSFVSEKPLDSLKIDALAKYKNISVSRLQHVFKERNGLRLKQLIIQEKISKAREMLPQKSILDTALDCGFYDQSHFCKNFKRYTGLTPQQYAKSIRRIGH